jgi:hypothetical protein
MMKRRELVEQLQRQTAEYFKKKGYPTTKCGYILDKWENWRGNIILPEVYNYVRDEIKSRKNTKIPFPLHKWIHHGLSSQACLFNLLGPLLVNKDYYAELKGILSLSDLEIAGNIIKAEFEFEDREVFNEHEDQPTSVDLYIETDKSEK